MKNLTALLLAAAFVIAHPAEAKKPKFEFESTPGVNVLKTMGYEVFLFLQRSPEGEHWVRAVVSDPLRFGKKAKVIEDFLLEIDGEEQHLVCYNSDNRRTVAGPPGLLSLAHKIEGNACPISAEDFERLMSATSISTQLTINGKVRKRNEWSKRMKRRWSRLETLRSRERPGLGS